MQKEYKEAMEQISLSDSDKARILANVKKACENRENDSSEIPVVKMHKRPDFSLQRMGTAVAACLVICVGALLILNKYGNYNSGVGGNTEGNLATPEPGAEVVWEELESVKEISEKTDCKTYTLGSVSRSYRVKKVEVANEQRHVRIIYRSKKEDDSILFEYKESGDPGELASQFEGEQTLSRETVGDKDVTLYGAGKCDGMTWEGESCAFAVRMTKARSKREAKALVSGTKQGAEDIRQEEKPDGAKTDKPDGSSFYANAVGWQGDEVPSGPVQRRKILRSVYERLGFRVTVVSPAEKVTYKKIGDYESFLFYYPQDIQLEEKKIIGYAGWESCPDGVLNGYEEVELVTVNGVVIRVYKNRNEEKLFRFKKQGISFTFLLEDFTGTEYEQVLGELLSVIRISMDSGISDDEKEPDDSSGDDDTDNSQEDKEIVAGYREQAQKIQDAVAEGNIHKLVRYVQFPVIVDQQGTTVSSEREFLEMDPSQLFRTEWVDAVVSFDTFRIHADTTSFIMGTEANCLVCKIKENTVVIAEIHSAQDDTDQTSEP